MTAEVVAVYASPELTGFRTDAEISGVLDVEPGDTLVLYSPRSSSAAIYRGTPYGLGAAWTELHSVYSPYWSVWVGVGGAGSGPVGLKDVENTGNFARFQLAVAHLRGAADPSLWTSSFATAAPGTAGIAAQAGDAVIAVGPANGTSMTSGWTLAPTPTLWSNVRCRTYTTEFRLSASTVPEGDTYSATTAASVTLPAVIRVPAWTPPEPEPEPEPLGQNATFWTHALAEALDLDPVEVQPVVEVRTRAPEGWVVDEGLSAALAGYTIRYGRSEASSDTPPMTASLTLATDLMATSTPTIGTQVQVGLCEPVATALGLTADQAIRFTGEVTDPTVDYRARLTTLTCTGRLGRLNRLPVDGTSWPVEDDATRVFRVLLALTNLLPVEFGDFDLGTYDVAPPDTVAPAATLLATTAASVVGQLVEQPTGHLDWQGADHRRGQVAHVALSAAAVFRAVSWSQRLADLVNLAEVKYATGAVQVGDAASADPATGYGPYSASVDTALVDEDDAYAIGTQYVARRSVPAWRLPDLQVDLLRTIALEQLPDVLTLRHGDKVALTGLPGECPLPEHVFAEGWTETATPRAWRLVLPVSDPIQSGVGLRWIDVPPTPEYRWADVDPTRTWLSAVRTENPADLT